MRTVLYQYRWFTSWNDYWYNKLIQENLKPTLY